MNDMMVNNDKTMDTDITTDRVTAGPGTDGRSGAAAARMPTPCLLVGLAPATDRRGLAP